METLPFETEIKLMELLGASDAVIDELIAMQTEAEAGKLTIDN